MRFSQLSRCCIYHISRFYVVFAMKPHRPHSKFLSWHFPSQFSLTNEFTFFTFKLAWCRSEISRVNIFFTNTTLLRVGTGVLLIFIVDSPEVDDETLFCCRRQITFFALKYNLYQYCQAQSSPSSNLMGLCNSPHYPPTRPKSKDYTFQEAEFGIC